MTNVKTINKSIQLFQKRLSFSIVDTATERNCGVQAAQIICYYYSFDYTVYTVQVYHNAIAEKQQTSLALCHSL